MNKTKIIIVIEQSDDGKYQVHRYDTIAHARAFIRSAAKSGGNVLGPFQVNKSPAEVAAELSLQACRYLDYAYFASIAQCGRIERSDLDEAHVEAIKAVRAARLAAKQETP